MRKIIFILLVGIVLASCGASKKVRQQVHAVEAERVEMVIRDTSAVHVNTDINVVVAIDVEEEEITITAADTTKAMIVDGKPYNNVVIKKKTKKDKSTSKDTTTIRRDSTGSIGGRTLKVNLKETSIDITDKETEEPFQFYLYAGGFIFLLLILYFIYRRITK